MHDMGMVTPPTQKRRDATLPARYLPCYLGDLGIICMYIHTQTVHLQGNVPSDFDLMFHSPNPYW